MRTFKGLKSGPTFLFIRLFFSFLLTAIVASGLVFLLMRSFRPAGGFHSVVEKNIDFYLTSLHNSVGPDFTADKISALEEKLGIKVQIANHQQSQLPTIDELKPEIEELYPRFTLGRRQGYFYAIHEGLTPRVAWMIKAHDLPKGFQMTFLGLIGFLLAIFIMTFVSVHFFMKPIRIMLYGIEQIASGNIRYRLSDRYKRRYSGILERFNVVADQLERFILSKDRLLRDVSHELRSPLTRMGVAIDLLDDSKLKDSLKKDSQIMNRLIHDLLESYRVQKSKAARQDIKLSDLFKSLQNYYQSADVEIKIAGNDSITWPLDPTLTEVILKNLIENSIKYTRNKQVLIEFEYFRNAQNLVIQCKDNGPGISVDDLPYIFEPFYRSSKSRQQTHPDGFGLGLSIVKTYAELQNGRIFAKNGSNGGVIFVLEFSS
tara:strand:- start:78029 stop:79321 length:1293 start_codon:yes stop_codon:yes gene_type:complete